MKNSYTPVPKTRTPRKPGRTPRRALPDVPLAVGCQAAIPGVCSGRAEQRHHIVLRSAGGHDGPTADLCAACHAYCHANPAWSHANGWIQRKAQP